MPAPRRRRPTYLAAAAEDVRRLHRENPDLALLVLQRLTDLSKGRLDQIVPKDQVDPPARRRPAIGTG